MAEGKITPSKLRACSPPHRRLSGARDISSIRQCESGWLVPPSGHAHHGLAGGNFGHDSIARTANLSYKAPTPPPPLSAPTISLPFNEKNFCVSQDIGMRLGTFEAKTQRYHNLSSDNMIAYRRSRKKRAQNGLFYQIAARPDGGVEARAQRIVWGDMPPLPFNEKNFGVSQDIETRLAALERQDGGLP